MISTTPLHYTYTGLSVIANLTENVCDLRNISGVLEASNYDAVLWPAWHHLIPPSSNTDRRT